MRGCEIVKIIAGTRNYKVKMSSSANNDKYTLFLMMIKNIITQEEYRQAGCSLDLDSDSNLVSV